MTPRAATRGRPPAPRGEIGRLLAAIRRGRTFFLTGHERPDGDTVGSELAFASFLRRRGKRVTIANTSPPPDYCAFLPGIARVKAAERVPGRFDVAVIFECSGPERMGRIIDLERQAQTVVNIDHHAHYGLFGDINLVDPGASSNSEQLLDVFDAARHALARAEATALYVGLVTDTGRFQQENTRARSHAVAARLLEAGVDVADVYRRVYGTRTPAAVRLVGRAMGGLRMAAGDRVAVLRLSRKDFEETGAADGDTEDIPNQGLLPPSALVSVFLRELRPGGPVKVSLRGKGRVDLCALAVSLGGGGHRNASGLTLETGLDEAEARIVGLLEQRLNRA